MKRIARALPSAAVLGGIFLCVVSAAIPAAGAPQDRASAPLGNEDVVRMLVAGRPAAEIIAAIRSAEVSFDLSDEMAQELRVAGVPAEVLAAMKARQAEMDRAREASRPPEATSQILANGKSLVSVTIRLGTKRDGSDGFVFPERLDDDTARTLSAGASAEERTVTDLAVFLACRTPDHVPDQWRSKSPLGRDFVSASRHEILDFRPGASRLKARESPADPRPPSPRAVPRDDEPGALLLPFPIELRGAIETGIAHDLTIGVAAQVAGRFLQIVEARRDGVVPGPEGLSLTAVLDERRGQGPRKIELRFEESAAGTRAR